MDEKKRRTTFKKNTAIPSDALEQGKIPPQAPELEEAVLGALMIEKDALTTVIDILQPESFYKDSHQRIYRAIQQLFQASEPIDLVTVVNQLRSNAELDIVGGPYYISQLTNRVASAANIEYHARIILQKHIQRELIKISSEVIRDAYDETTDVFDLLDSAEAKLFQVAQGNIRKSHDTMSELIRAAKKNIEESANKGEGVTGVPTGFNRLDALTAGWQPSDLVILAARPGMGKTAFVLSIARNAAVDFNKGVAVFSLEMASVQLVTRLIAAETELSAEKLKKGNLQMHEWEQLNSKVSKLTEAPLYIDDTPGLSVFELRAKARRLKQQHDIQMIIIDYLQLMTAGGDHNGNREQEISTISRSLKMIAKELQVPVIALSQLSRAVETRGGDKKPQLSDLRESGAIEQDADMVTFIYRPEYYNITEDEDGRDLRGIGEIIIAKHRNGGLDTVPLKFTAHLAKFSNLEADEFVPFQEPDQNQEENFFSNSTIKSSRMDEIDDDVPF